MSSEFNPSEFIYSTDSNPTSPIIFNETESLPNQGGMSIVQKTKILGKWHLIKRLKQEYSKHPVYITNFEKEFDIAYHLDHPHIVRYLNKGANVEGAYIIMEYIDGRTLKSILQKEGTIKSEKISKRIALQLLEALSYLHKHQIYHLDLKPENIMLTHKGDNIKLLDFGLSNTDSHLLIDGGTLKYASPEQISSAGLVDGRSDIYSFGLLLLELIEGDTNKKNITKIKGVFKNVIAKCLMEAPTARFQTADEVLEFINTNDKRKNTITYSVVATLIIFSVLFYLLIGDKNNNAAFQTELPQPTIQPIDKEKTTVTTSKESKTPTTVMVDKKEFEKKTGTILNTYYASDISIDDSIKCVELGKHLYTSFIEKVEHYDKAPTTRSRMFVLQSINDSCELENQKQWKAFSGKFTLGSVKYSRAERIYSKAQRISADKIWSVLFPNKK
jgi:serine/threonine protein kinase